MKWTEQQYERMALWMDGQEVSLSAEELTEAQRLAGQEADLGALLDAPLPPTSLAVARNALRRARRTSASSVEPPRSRVLRIIVEVAALAVAAVLVVTLMLPGPAPARPRRIPTAVLFPTAPSGTARAELDALAERMDQIETVMLASVPPMPEEGLAQESPTEEKSGSQWLEEMLEELSS